MIAGIALCCAAAAGPYPQSGGYPLPGGLALNGRFDVAYERLRYTADPTEGGHAFRSYHHFLFLTRQAAGDPFGLNVEIVEQQFYEASLRLRAGPVGVALRIGKILVPFGDEPLFHHSYGGRSGFDQQLLPVVWAQHGAALEVSGRLRGARLTGELYAVNGFRLVARDAVLDLQADLAPLGRMKLGAGGRVGAAIGPLCAWYSAYANRLGFGRLLVLQAIDVGIYRPVDLPLLRDLALSLGAARADVSGGEGRGVGGVGRDYYHFADYVTARWFALDWLTLQLRTGLRTTDNRRGLWLDETRLDAADTSSHNITVSAHYGGATVALQHFWNLEKNDEQDDDLLRLVVTYEL